MNRLQLELNRLYGLDTAPTNEGVADAAPEDDPQAVRALVLELAQPAGWAQLSSVWTGAQVDLGLPAPAIAVSGVDGLQLWFSLAAPVSRRVGALFLEAVRARYLPDVKPAQVRLSTRHAALPTAPPAETGPDRWSAFVAPDLAALFADTPWLDVPPPEEGQVSLLRAIEPTSPAAFAAATALLDASAGDARRDAANAMHPAAPVAGADPRPIDSDPVRFLTGVMNDATVPLALRVEAAKALLPYRDRS